MCMVVPILFEATMNEDRFLNSWGWALGFGHWESASTVCLVVGIKCSLPLDEVDVEDNAAGGNAQRASSPMLTTF